MKKYSIFFLTLSLMMATGPLEAINESLLFGKEDPLHIVINNRILAKVNGKAISVIDVMKKMDLLFYRQYPEYTSSIPARFQFYQVNWKHFLNELIDKELILADAEEKKLPVSSGDIRQEMESTFGPNIIGNLDKIGMSYEDANNIIKGEIIIRRMLYIRVNSQALRQITPQSLRGAYEQYAKENIKPEEWIYDVISVRHADSRTGQEIADTLCERLKEKPFDAESISELIKDKEFTDKAAAITLSSEYKHSEKEMSAFNKEALLKLSNNEYSAPVSQKSRADKAMVFRIFYLKEKTSAGALPFTQVENQLKDKLLDAAVEKESDKYITKLRGHFDLQESHLLELSDEDFQPFHLQ